MSVVPLVICILAGLVVIGIVLYLATARRYKSSGTVARSYDQWTNDGILEFYWGEHIHLGHYGSPPRRRDFLAAKEDFVHEMVRWEVSTVTVEGRPSWTWAAESAAAVGSLPGTTDAR